MSIENPTKKNYGNRSRCADCNHPKGPRKNLIGKTNHPKKSDCGCGCHVKKTEEKHLKAKE